MSLQNGFKTMKGTTAPLDPNAQHEIKHIPISGFSVNY